MGIFEENKKKREAFIDKFYLSWYNYCNEHNIHHKEDEAFSLDFNGKERNYVSDAESLLGWYLAMYGGLESIIPREIRMDYPEESKNKDSIVFEALGLFYKTACNLKESLDISDLIANEYEGQSDKYMQFYFVTTNGFKEFEDMTGCKEYVKEKLYDKNGEQGVSFDEENFKEDYYVQIFGNFYENGKCDIYLECNHCELDESKIYNLKEYLETKDTQVFWDLVKKTDEWQEFVEKTNEYNMEL